MTAIQARTAASSALARDDIALEPFVSGVVDSKPIGFDSGNIDNEQLIVLADVRFKPVLNLGRRMSASHDPYRLEMMPPVTERFYGRDQIVIGLAAGVM